MHLTYDRQVTGVTYSNIYMVKSEKYIAKTNISGKTFNRT